MILQQHVQQYPVIVRRSLHPDSRIMAPGRTKEEAVAQMKKNARDYGYYDCTDVEPAPETGSKKDDGLQPRLTPTVVFFLGFRELIQEPYQQIP